MKQREYEQLNTYMQSCMKDSAHDREHVYRVLYAALEIAKAEKQVNYDILITACLLHDIGRQAQIENPTLCHAEVGAKMAQEYLSANGYSSDFTEQVAECIRSHRFRKEQPPKSIEAKILFDADKLDVTGAMGVARTLLYAGRLSGPLYNLKEDGTVSDGTEDTSPSFFQEYKFKLERLYDRFFTERGKELAAQRQQAAKDFYLSLLSEVNDTYSGKDNLSTILEP